MTKTLTAGQVVRFYDETETATVLDNVFDQDEGALMLRVRWNGTGRITHEYPRDIYC
jgi:hypothetical protein